MNSPKLITDNRPWGKFEQFSNNTPSTVKILTVLAGEAFSLQKHVEREEYWYIISGEGIATIGEDNLLATAGREFFVPKGVAHRFSANTDTKVLEISFGEFDENDIIRIEDKYGRD